MTGADVDEFAVVDLVGHGGVSTAPREQWMVERGEQVDVLDPTGADRTDGISVSTLEHHRKPGEAVVDDLLEHEVGFVEPALWTRPTRVVDLDDQRRSSGDRRIRVVDTCQRIHRLRG